MKKQVFELLKNTFSFVVSSFLSQNPVEYISLNVVINEKDKMKVCTTQMRSFSIVQKDNRNPEIKIHESSVLSSTRGSAKHGSCGLGIGETIHRSEVGHWATALADPAHDRTNDNDPEHQIPC